MRQQFTECPELEALPDYHGAWAYLAGRDYEPISEPREFRGIDLEERAKASTLKVEVASMDDLLKMTPDQLTKQANVMLYGSPVILEEAEERQIIRRLYIPRNLNRPLIYTAPRNYPGMSERLRKHYVCESCGRARSYSSGRRCRFCYTLAVRLKFYEASEGAAWLEYQARGIVMPETEWWDDSDVPATPKRLGPVSWGIDRLDWSKAA